MIGQAPGLRVHETGLPFNDASGERLRAWMGVSRDVFYDHARIAITPMAFCFPGYDAKGSDLPPPPICAKTWHDQVMQDLDTVRLTDLAALQRNRWPERRHGHRSNTARTHEIDDRATEQRRQMQ